MVPLLQPVALHRTTRMKLRRHREVLPGLRKRLLGAAPASEAPQVQLERVRPRTLITLVAGVVAAYLLIGQISNAALATALAKADWRWGVLVLLVSAVTYVGATFELTGFVLEPLSLTRTFLAQIAGSFVTLVTPAAVGGVALNIRYLRKANVSPADAGSSVGISQVIAFTPHLVLLIIFATFTRAASKNSLRPQRPAKLAVGIGGALLLTAAYIFCLDASILALGGSVALTSVAVVYLTGSAIGSAVPTPGGLGAVEAALSAGLIAAGLPGAKAIGAVLLFRLATFWLPVPIGWIAMNYLQRHDAL